MTLQRPTHQLHATVLGAGTMGAQIAAHLANAGIPTHLLDIVPKGVEADAPRAARDAIAAGALRQMAKAKPAPFMDPGAAARITVGNLDDDLEDAVSRSHLVVEAVIERLEVKQPLFARIAAAAPGDAVLATNTSGLPVGAIAGGLPEPARKRVVGMHFFNPPRYMHLLEVVPSSETDPAVVRDLVDFCDRVLGKGVVVCRDTPNFVANRIGVAATILGFRATFEGGYTVEEVDLLNGPLVGRPRTGSFRLGDLVGIDVTALVVDNLRAATSADPASPDYDELNSVMIVPPPIQQMLAKGLRGDKTGAGFYRRVGDGAQKKVLSIDFGTLDYRERIEPDFSTLGPELADIAKIPDLRGRVSAALRAPGRGGDFLRRVYLPLFNYAAARLGRICDDPKPIDDAMCWGYGWSAGPFQLWDMVGVAWGVEQLEQLGVEPATAVRELVAKRGKEATWYAGTEAAPKVWVPARGDYREVEAPMRMIVLGARRAAGGTLHETRTASLVDLGEGIACIEFRSKMNTLDDGVLQMLREGPEFARRRGFRGLVVGSQADNFSAGADARMILKLASEGNWEELGAAVRGFQDALMDLRHGALPVVAAPYGLTLGGGAECTMSCAAVVANAELYMGLVEAGIGVVPAGGGLKEMVRRAWAWASQVEDGDPYPWLRRAFELAGQGKVSGSAFEARRFGYLRDDDGIVFHRMRVIEAAKRRAIALAETGWVPPDRNEPISVIGTGRGASFFMGAQIFHWSGHASAHDKLVAEKIAHVLSGGDRAPGAMVTAQQLLELEREAFVSLCGTEKTRARIEHTLKTGKPLRN